MRPAVMEPEDVKVFIETDQLEMVRGTAQAGNADMCRGRIMDMSCQAGGKEEDLGDSCSEGGHADDGDPSKDAARRGRRVT